MQQTSDISTAKLVIVLTRAYRSLADFLEGGLALQGILTTDFAILEVLLHKGPLAMSAIGPKISLATSLIKRAIDRLKRRGLVRGQDDRNTPHAEVYELTEEGHKTITRVYARHKEDIEAVIGVLSPKERSQLWQALKKVGLQGERCQRARSKERRGGLAPWQLRRATEYMTEHLGDPMPLKDLAEQTGLSPSRFGRAFKLSMGISLHRWQMNLRILEGAGVAERRETTTGRHRARDGVRRAESFLALSSRKLVACHLEYGSASIAHNLVHHLRGTPQFKG